MTGVSSGPLARRRIVVTRAEGQAGDLVRRLREAGADVILCPVIESRAAIDPAPLAAVLADLHSVDWIAFTSVNAVAAVFDRASSALVEASLTGSNPRFAAVGPATAGALVARRAHVAFTPAQHTAIDLALGLPALRGQVVLLPRSDIAPPDFPDALRARGLILREVVAYRTERAVADSGSVARAASADAITFTSASAARAFLDAADAIPGAATAMRAQDRPVLVCLGPQTAAAVRDRGWIVDAVAPTHTLEGLLDVLADLYAADPISQRA